MKKKIISSMLAVIFTFVTLVPLSTTNVHATGSTTITGDYVLILNESLSKIEQTGSIVFDDTAINAPSYSNDAIQTIPLTPAIADTDTRSITKTYTVGDTNPLLKRPFTVKGIGDHCVIWMDDNTTTMYNNAGTLAAAVSGAINTYENKSFPVLRALGANTKMAYNDGSGKLSIFLEDTSDFPRGRRIVR